MGGPRPPPSARCSRQAGSPEISTGLCRSSGPTGLPLRSDPTTAGSLHRAARLVGGIGPTSAAHEQNLPVECWSTNEQLGRTTEQLIGTTEQLSPTTELL